MSTADLEHRELDRTLAEVEFLAQKRTFGPAAKRFIEFRRALEAHLGEEETITFPGQLQRRPELAAALELIRAQHVQLAVALNEITTSLQHGDYTAFCTGLDRLDAMLKDHELAEERLLS